MDLIKETKVIPSLVNPINFKPVKVPTPSPVETFKKNSQLLNITLLIAFLIFFGVFLLFCKYGKTNTDEPEPYSFVYNLNSF